MNRFAKLIVVMLGVTLMAIAPVSAKIENGVKLGLNFASLSGSDDTGFESRTGFLIGYYLAFEIAPNLAVQTELLYSQKGATGDYYNNLDVKFTMNYLEIPILLRYTFSAPDGAGPFLVFGPSLALNNKGEVSYTNSLDETIWKDMSNQKTVDIGLVMGGGISVNSGSRKIFLDARYTYGLSNVFDDVPPFQGVDPWRMVEVPMARVDGQAFDLKNGALTIMIGVQL